MVLNPEYGDITDPDVGTDLVIHYGKPAGAQFPQTKITPRRRSSLLCEDQPEKCAEMLESIPDFDGLFEKKSFQEVQSMLDEFLSDEQTTEESSEEQSKYNEVDNAFKELLA